jgi:hypothetical protein
MFGSGMPMMKDVLPITGSPMASSIVLTGSKSSHWPPRLGFEVAVGVALADVFDELDAELELEALLVLVTGVVVPDADWLLSAFVQPASTVIPSRTDRAPAAVRE